MKSGGDVLFKAGHPATVRSGSSVFCVIHRADRLIRDFAQICHVYAGPGEQALDGVDAQPVQLVIPVPDPLPAGPTALDHLDAPGTIRRLHRVLDHGAHLATIRPAQTR